MLITARLRILDKTSQYACIALVTRLVLICMYAAAISNSRRDRFLGANGDLQLQPWPAGVWGMKWNGKFGFARNMKHVTVPFVPLPQLGRWTRPRNRAKPPERELGYLGFVEAMSRCTVVAAYYSQ